LTGYGAKVAATTTSWPWPVPLPTDNVTLRWVVRRGDPGEGSFLFINNYERTGEGIHPTLPAKELVRLSLNINGSSTPIIIPSTKSKPLTIPSDVWMDWPIDMQLCAQAATDFTASGVRGAGPVLVYATAQLVARVKNTAGSAEILFLVETEGIEAEFAFSKEAATVVPSKATVSTEGDLTVFRKISAGTSAFATVQDGQTTLSIVLLPAEMADSVWLQSLDGIDRLFISDSTTSPEVLVMAENKTLHFRTGMLTDSPQKIRMFPPVPGLKHLDGSTVPSAADGVFTTYIPKLEPVAITAPTITHLRKAGPARNVTQGGRAAREPTMGEWHAAEVWNISLAEDIPETGGDYRLLIDYIGDCARLYFGSRLLTDNWQSGYSGRDGGGMEVGLNYLSGENPGLLKKGAQLQLWILPITAYDLSSPNIYLQPRLWPKFDSEGSALKLNGVTVAGLRYTDMTVA
jgi:hypothetical protein